MNYNVGDIFTDDEFYTDRANFCNENGFFIEEIEPLENDIRQFKICASKEKTLSELKSEKLSELTLITSKFDNQLVNTDMIIKSSLGFSINADLRSQLNIHRLISIGAEPVSFIVADNTTVDLSLAQLNILISECEENMQHLFDLKQSYKKQITDATTKEELDAIDLQFTMKDFS